MDTSVCFVAQDGRKGFGEASATALTNCLGTQEANAILSSTPHQGDYFPTQEFVEIDEAVICYHERSTLTCNGHCVGAFLAAP